jgi:hypothetical protein
MSETGSRSALLKKFLGPIAPGDVFVVLEERQLRELTLIISILSVTFGDSLVHLSGLFDRQWVGSQTGSFSRNILFDLHEDEGVTYALLDASTSQMRILGAKK